MNRMNEQDMLRGENWAQIYSEVPDSVINGMDFAFRRIQSRERRRRRTLRIAACAACLCAALGICTAALLKHPAPDVPDTVAPQEAEVAVLRLDDPVLTSDADPCFHRHGECPEKRENAVEVKLVTALEFEKTPCGVCCANVKIED